MNILVPLRGGLYCPDIASEAGRPPVPIMAHIRYLLDADSHHHAHGLCGTWCPRAEVLIKHIKGELEP